MTRRHLLAGAAGGVLCLLVMSSSPFAQAGAVAAPPTLLVTGDVRTPLSLTPDQLKAMPRTRVEVKDEDGRTVTYEGVLVGELLTRAGATLGGDRRRT